MATPTQFSAPPTVCILRIAAVLGLWWASYLLVVNLIDSYREFDPSYLGYYFGQVLLRPLLLLFWSTLLWLLAPRIARTVHTGEPQD